MSGFHHSDTQLGQVAGQKAGQKSHCLGLNFFDIMGKSESITPYKLAKVYIGPKEAHVEFYYYCTEREKYIRKKLRLGKKGISDEEKSTLLHELCYKTNKLIKERNAKGLYQSDFTGNPSGFDIKMRIPEALFFVKDSKDEDLSEDRLSCLNDTAQTFTKFFIAHETFVKTKISSLSEVLIKLFIKWCKENERAGKTINKYLSTLQFATEWLKRKKHIPDSFDTAPYRVAQPKNETGRFPPLTHEEKLAAFSYFNKKDRNYLLFLFWNYYTCIRGAELYRIKREYINFENKTVFLSWFDTKNGLSNHVELFDPLVDLLLELGIDKLGGDMFIFGKHFIPSYEQYEGDQASDKWFNHRDNMRMPKKKQAYGLKHTFNVDYVENNKYNIDWEFLRRHNRHATVQQTQQYISELTAYFLDQTKNVIVNYKVLLK